MSFLSIPGLLSFLFQFPSGHSSSSFVEQSVCGKMFPFQQNVQFTVYFVAWKTWESVYRFCLWPYVLSSSISDESLALLRQSPGAETSLRLSHTLISSLFLSSLRFVYLFIQTQFKFFFNNFFSRGKVLGLSNCKCYYYFVENIHLFKNMGGDYLFLWKC